MIAAMELPSTTILFFAALALWTPIIFAWFRPGLVLSQNDRDREDHRLEAVVLAAIVANGSFLLVAWTWAERHGLF